MLKLMLLEDDLNVFALLQMFLEGEGYEVAHWQGTEDLDGLVRMIQAEEPDIALVDVHLRHLNGIDLLRQLRRDSSLDQMRILMASGMDLAAECLKEGADGFILKPFMPDELIYKIERIMGA